MGVIFSELLMLELFGLFFAFMFSATDKNYLLKVSAVSCLYLINFPSTFNVHIFSLFVPLPVSNFTIAHMI
jgi:hypothetical protein